MYVTNPNQMSHLTAEEGGKYNDCKINNIILVVLLLVFSLTSAEENKELKSTDTQNIGSLNFSSDTMNYIKQFSDSCTTFSAIIIPKKTAKFH
ncbi:hypothetical protein C0J52_27050 [Blattella germanica]|nr:hypothetical protein C0J52_27050 [Blattella germanica]